MIYMTTYEWRELSKIIESKDFEMLAREIKTRARPLYMSNQELDHLIEDYTTNECVAEIIKPKDGAKRHIECDGYSYKVVFQKLLNNIKEIK